MTQIQIDELEALCHKTFHKREDIYNYATGYDLVNGRYCLVVRLQQDTKFQTPTGLEEIANVQGIIKAAYVHHPLAHIMRTADYEFAKDTIKFIQKHL